MKTINLSYNYISRAYELFLQHPKDGIHNVRSFIGNGLRQDIWTPLQTRFKIPNIVEFFGASEGTGAVVNVCNRPGAVGRISPLLVRAIISICMRRKPIILFEY